MDPSLAHQNLKTVTMQRNLSFVVCAILMSTTFVMSLCLIIKKEKTIIVPASLSRQVELRGHELSVEYLEEMTAFFMTLLLDLTPDNIDYKSSQLLKYTEPKSYHALEAYFKSEADKHKKYHLTTTFTLLETKIIPNTLTAQIKGVLSAKFAAQGSHQENVTYQISYQNSGGRLLITKFDKL